MVWGPFGNPSLPSCYDNEDDDEDDDGHEDDDEDEGIIVMRMMMVGFSFGCPTDT